MATALNIPTNNSTTDFTNQASSFLPELWKKGVQLSEAAENFFNQFEGPTESYPIMSIRDLSRGAGTKITFRTMAQLYGEGVTGDTLVNDNTEDFRVGAYNLTVDFLRHAVSYNRRLEEKTALASELKSNVPVMLGNWLGRIKTEKLMKMFLHKGRSKNYIYANNKSGVNALRSSDVVSYDGIIAAGQQLRTRGARPATVATINKNKINRYVVVSTGEGLLSLKSESKSLAAVQAAAAAEGYNGVQFTGGFVDLYGHAIRQFNPTDHDGFGAIGSPLNAKASAGNAVNTATGTSAITLQGGGAASAAGKAPYFKLFSGYAYKFIEGDSLSTGAGFGASEQADGFVLLVNPTNGKYNIFHYSANNGTTLTLDRTLIASGTSDASGAFRRLTAADWNTAYGSAVVTTAATDPFHSDKITNSFPVGSLIIECNASGVAIGRSLVLGAMAAVRGYGSLDGERSEENHDGEFVRKTYITSIFGQSPYVRPDGEQPNYLVLTHAVNYAGLTLPVIA